MRSSWIVVTGANTGIGRAAALRLGRLGKPLILAGRSPDRHADTLAALDAMGARAQFVTLDLGSLASVRAAAKTILGLGPIDVLVNNAGLAGARGATSDGFELAFGTNHLGPYLFTRLLLPSLTKRGRIVNVSSIAHKNATSIPWASLREPTRTVSGIREYAVSKLANVLFTKELARRLPIERATAHSLHPGRVDTDVWRRIPRPAFRLLALLRPMLSADAGAETTLYCALDAAVGKTSGGYYDDCRLGIVNPLADDAELARELWDASARWVGLPPGLTSAELRGRDVEHREVAR